jgi:hypothetical protein
MLHQSMPPEDTCPDSAKMVLWQMLYGLVEDALFELTKNIEQVHESILNSLELSSV